MAIGSDVVNSTHDHKTFGKAKKGSSRDVLSGMDALLAKVELVVGKLGTSLRIPMKVSKSCPL